MFEALKKTLFAGLGATIITSERLRKLMDELVEKGKLSAREAQEMAEKIMAEGEKEFDESSNRLGALFDEALRKANFARQRDFEQLAARVARLEAAAAAPSGIPPQPTPVPPQPTPGSTAVPPGA